MRPKIWDASWTSKRRNEGLGVGRKDRAQKKVRFGDSVTGFMLFAAGWMRPLSSQWWLSQCRHRRKKKCLNGRGNCLLGGGYLQNLVTEQLQ